MWKGHTLKFFVNACKIKNNDKNVVFIVLMSGNRLIVLLLIYETKAKQYCEYKKQI